MNSYFVIGYKKLKADGITKAIEHNLRKIAKILKHINNRENIILEKMDFKNDKEHVEYCNNRLAKGKRKTKEDVAHGFEIIIDCSKDYFKNEEEHLQYLKDANDFIKEWFKGQLILNSVIHLDEGKPHLHMLISFYNEDKQKWNQKDLMKEGKTDLNQLLKEFENKIGKKYGLKKGDYQTDEAVKRETKKLLKETIEIEEKGIINKHKEWKVKDKNKLLNELKKGRQAQSTLKRLNEKMKAKEKEEFRNLTNKEKARQLHPSNIILDEKLENINKANYLINNPLRKDEHPSMSVYQDSSGAWLYYDHATDETIDNITMYIKLNNCNYNEAVKELAGNETKINENIAKKVINEIDKKAEKEAVNSKIYHPQHNFIGTDKEKYIKERLSTNSFIKPPEVVELKEELNGKRYSYIALKNRSGGYACRNKYIKKNIGKNNYTNIDNKSSKTVVTEGLMDYISLYQKYKNTVNYVILNSVTNIKKLINDKIDIIKDKNILLYLDNDNAGDKATELFKDNFNAEDKRIEYYGYNDITDKTKHNNELTELMKEAYKEEIKRKKEENRTVENDTNKETTTKTTTNKKSKSNLIRTM